MLVGKESSSDKILSDKEEVLKEEFTDILAISYKNVWKSPFPSPEILKAYNDAFENGAQMIFLQIQKEMDSRIEFEKLIILKQLKQSRLGQIYGLIIALCFLVASFILVYIGQGIYGTIIGSVNIVTLVTTFVLNKKQREFMENADV